MENGRLKKNELHRVYHPSLELHLAADGASASWNSMRMHLLHTVGKHADIYAEGPLGSYRNFAGQVKCKALYGSNAATPGTSNHGLGHAVDVATTDMANSIDKCGGMFGWHHWDAKWEWWHREYDGGFDRPDPGVDIRNPVLRKGSGGPGQSWAVEHLQNHLNDAAGAQLKLDGDFGGDTRKAVVSFQRKNGIRANGVVGKETWNALRKAPVKGKPAKPPKAPPEEAKPQAVSAKKPVRGFDASDVQGDIDFDKAKAAGNAFASIRIADGDIRDARYGPGRIKALRESGLAWFPYYYGRVAGPHNGQRNGADEAKMAIGFAKSAGWGKPGDLPLTYDFENLNGQPAKKCARHLIQFIKAYKSAMGHHPIIYTMPGFWGSIYPHFNSKESAIVKRCPLWIAHWGVPEPQYLSPWGKQWMLWQDSDHGDVGGVSGKVDTDWFKYSANDFGKLIVP